jgi:hypothetical protein
MEHEEWKPNQPNQTCYGCLIAQRVNVNKNSKLDFQNWEDVRWQLENKMYNTKGNEQTIIGLELSAHRKKQPELTTPIFGMIAGFFGLLSFFALPRCLSNFFAGVFNGKTKYLVYERMIEIQYNSINKYNIRILMYQIPMIQLFCPFPLNFSNDWVFQIPFDQNTPKNTNLFSILSSYWEASNGYSLFINKSGQATEYEEIDEIRTFIDRSSLKDREDRWKI